MRRTDIGATGATENHIQHFIGQQEEDDSPNPIDFIQGSRQSLKPFAQY